MSEDKFPPRLTDIIRKVFGSDISSVYIIIAKNILNSFFSLYTHLRNPAKFMDTYRKKFILRGHKIKYLGDDKKHVYKVLGVDVKNCSLIVEDEHKKVVTIATPNKVIIPKKISNK